MLRIQRGSRGTRCRARQTRFVLGSRTNLSGVPLRLVSAGTNDEMVTVKKTTHRLLAGESLRLPLEIRKHLASLHGHHV